MLIINAVTKQICFKYKIKLNDNYNIEVKCETCTNTIIQKSNK